MKIAIIGAGNVGIDLAVTFSLTANHIFLYSKSFKGNSKQKFKLLTKSKTIESKDIYCTNNLSEVIKDASYIFITYPSFLYEDLAKDLIPIISNQVIVGVPASGGFEIAFRDALDKDCIICGLQRTHAIDRLIDFNIVMQYGVKDRLYCTTIPKRYANKVCEDISKLYDLPVSQLQSFINITLVNSNQILHPARLYNMNPINDKFFYSSWNAKSSIDLVDLDDELQDIADIFNVKLESILDHYYINSIDKLDYKLKNIDDLKYIESPIDNNSFNFNSRYFKEDFDYGLDFIISLANKIGYKAYKMIEISDWYHKLTNTKRYDHLKNITLNDLMRLYTL